MVTTILRIDNTEPIEVSFLSCYYEYVTYRNSNKWQSGKMSYYVYVLLAVIIVGATIMSNGIFPAFPQNPSDPAQFEISKKIDGKNKQPNLQLKAIKVKCNKPIAAAFLIDTSGSMKDGNKLAYVKAALSDFAEEFPSDGVIAMWTYGDTVVEAVSPTEYGNAQADFSAAVASLQPESTARTKDAFSFALQRLTTTKRQYPNHKFHVIVISAGVPETAANNQRLGKNHQYDPSQDPTAVAAAMKDSGIEVYTIALTDTVDAATDKKNKELMLVAASGKDDTYVPVQYSELPGTAIKISKKMCG